MAMYSRKKQCIGTEVYVNVYDLVDMNSYFYSIGFGIFHTGVEISGVEYSFGEGSGITQGVPKEVDGATFRESVLIGVTDLSSMEITKHIDNLRDQFRGDQYHIILKNCNHFSDALCKSLLGIPIPSYINRCAYLASWFSCLFPQKHIESDEKPTGRFVGQGNVLSSERKSASLSVDAKTQRELRLKALGK